MGRDHRRKITSSQLLLTKELINTEEGVFLCFLFFRDCDLGSLLQWISTNASHVRGEVSRWPSFGWSNDDLPSYPGRHRNSVTLPTLVVVFLKEGEEKALFYGYRENRKRSFRLADPEFSFAVDAGYVVQLAERARWSPGAQLGGDSNELGS